MNIYAQLAHLLDTLPNGFPSVGDGSELRVLEKLFTPEQAEAAILLTPELETAESIASRTGRDTGELRKLLKGMTRSGLIACDKTEGGLGYKLMPFVVGFYEEQVSRMDESLARVMENYFKKAFGLVLQVKPQFHRVVPVGETIRSTIEVHPYESATALVNAAKAWGVFDCICRKQKALVGEACGHPIDVCMVLYDQPGVFDNSSTIRAVSREEALATLERASKAGLIHSVSNNKDGNYYICNCCTCSCGFLRGMAELGFANVMARSAFVNTVDETLCNACEACLSYCSFDALAIENSVVRVNLQHCVGCGICVPACPTGALILVRRPEEEILPIPETSRDWGAQRLAARGKIQA